MKYNCTDCNYSTDDKGNWSRHNKSKTHLKKVEDATNLKKLQADDKSSGQLSGQLSGHISGHISDIPFNASNDKNKEKFICPYCDQSFSLKANLYRHKNHRCSKNPDKINGGLNVKAPKQNESPKY